MCRKILFSRRDKNVGENFNIILLLNVPKSDATLHHNSHLLNECIFTVM